MIGDSDIHGVGHLVESDVDAVFRHFRRKVTFSIADIKIHVSTSDTHRVVLHRNVKRYTYSCANNCERVEMLGDVVTDKNPIPDFSDMDEANTRKLKIAEEGKKISEDAG